MSTPQPPTKGQKLFILFISMAFLSSFLYSPKASQVEPRIARQAQIQDLSKHQIGYLDSELYQSGLENNIKIIPMIEDLESFQSSESVGLDAKTEIAKIEKYRQSFFPNSPISAEMIYKNSVKSGIPASFFLAACHNESHCGTMGRAVETKNVFNVGNTDCGDHKPVAKDNCNNFINDWQKGFDTFTSLIKTCYFKPNEPITLQTWIARDFRAVSCNIIGKRYMTSPLARELYLDKITSLLFYKIN